MGGEGEAINVTFINFNSCDGQEEMPTDKYRVQASIPS